MDHQEKQRIDNALSVTFLQLPEKQEKISTKINKLSMDVSKIGFYQLLQNANEQLRQNNNVLFDILTELEDAIVFSNMGKVHPSVISINDIGEMRNGKVKIAPNVNVMDEGTSKSQP
ncbi:hypothetical protein QE152_g38062 [Popillia japonica]|uniref:Uncharacterized protein n=1 Tax=Popillia japonica TaxID=7064 RepID=A0AAW1I858_POPJA